MNILDRYFRITDNGSNVRTEVLAGLSTYLSLAYIFVLNPAILHSAGMSTGAVLFATIIASGLSTLLMGLWARLPFALAPGLEMNGFFAFTVCGTMGLSWQAALGAVFWSGLLCILFTWIPARGRIIDSIPNTLKANIAVAVGVFVFTIGLFLAKIAIFDNGFPKGVGSFTSPQAIALYIGLAVSVILGHPKLKFPGGMLVAIIVAAVYCKTQGIVATTPAAERQDWLSAFCQLDLWAIFTQIKLLPVFLVLFLIDFYGSIGKFIGLTAATGIQKDGQVRDMGKAMYVDGIGTVGGAVLGTSSIITYVESAVGIGTGGRTGLVSVVTGVLMLCSLAFSSLVGLIPVEATAGVLVYVGWLLLPRQQWAAGMFHRFDIATAVIMGLLCLAFFNLSWAMLAGFVLYTVKHVFSSEHKDAYLIGSTIVLALSVILQQVMK